MWGCGTAPPQKLDASCLVRVRAIWRRGARLDQRDGDFDLEEYRPQTWALVREAVEVDRLREDLPIYRIDGDYGRRLDEGPASPEEKAAEIEAALEYEIKVGGGEKNPVTRSLADRLERVGAGNTDSSGQRSRTADDPLIPRSRRPRRTQRDLVIARARN